MFNDLKKTSCAVTCKNKEQLMKIIRKLKIIRFKVNGLDRQVRSHVSICSTECVDKKDISLWNLKP
jgi:hypothetical protein